MPEHEHLEPPTSPAPRLRGRPKEEFRPTTRNFEKAKKKARGLFLRAKESFYGRWTYPYIALGQLAIPVSRETLEAAIAATSTNSKLYLMVLYLLIGSIRDRESDNLMIPIELIQSLCNRRIKTYHELECALNPMGIRMVTNTPYAGRVRHIETLSLSPDLEELRDRIIRDKGIGETYWLHNGRRVSQASIAGVKDLSTEIANPNSPESLHWLLCELNAPGRRYEKLISIAQEIRTAIIGTGQPLDTASERDVIHLRKIEVNPQPKYHEVRKSNRLYASNSFPLLSRSTRKALIAKAGWMELDLKYSQTSIARNLLGLNDLDIYLNHPAGFWMSMLDDLGHARSAENKQALKNCIYRLVFGGSLVWVANCPKLRFYGKPPTQTEIQIATSLRASSVGTSIGKSLSNVRKKIRRKRFIVDAFGIKYDLNHLVISNDLAINNTEEITNKAVRSLQSRWIQSFEYAILSKATLSMFDKYGGEVALVGWLHDSVILERLTCTNAGAWKARLQAEVKEAEEVVYGEFGILPKHRLGIE
ncbi:hypothetical protein IQ258_19665 [Coleofasciculus sp. LEGE 07081]|uniref:hypothetical protein n=1 Tax=Coleofasciculus sp. LEGE 07081 TaxID=2777967 RepID=UPI0018829C9E|nr:hypothetical protein [Coleofasciculus sp. LEGE 07081]MBE9128321.1 hypothetical protein [Coleofasciculus sp. LEGE 07081]